MKIDWTKYKYVDHRIQDGINQKYIENGDYELAIENLAFCHKHKMLFSGCCGKEVSNKLDNIQELKYYIDFYKTLLRIKKDKLLLNSDMKQTNNLLKEVTDNIKKLSTIIN